MARNAGIIKVEVFFVLLLLILVSGCQIKAGKQSSKDTSKGTDGITINFLPNNPQDKYIVSTEEEEPIYIILELRNKGSYPRENDINELSRGQVHISGFDDNIIHMEENSKRLDRQFLEGRSSINPEGGFDMMEFKGSIYTSGIVIEKYEPTILATLCYPYATKASPSVCIDPFPFDEKQKKVCRIGSQTLTSQGAPVAITSIDEEASSTKIQFKINLKNAGGGDIIKLDSLDRCNPTGGQALDRNDFDRIELVRAEAGLATLRCGPFAEGNGIIRLNNGQGFVICSLDKDSYQDTKSAYTTPLNLEFRYGYRTTASKPIKISKITTTS
ncbi:hypothetical protein HYU50_04190 [Candidatus Woesearchaeota archaeon]|nr:hypothetical protein [Candidatus Woesearchaeota archaeon]